MVACANRDNLCVLHELHKRPDGQFYEKLFRNFLEESHAAAIGFGAAALVPLAPAAAGYGRIYEG